MATRSAYIQTFWKNLSDSLWNARVGAETTTTFSLYRRQRTSQTRNDLGNPLTQYDLIAANVPCVFIGSFSKRSERFYVKDPGQFQREMTSMYTSYQDIHPGDQVVMAYDGKAFLVQSATQEGTLRRAELDEMQQQLQLTSP